MHEPHHLRRRNPQRPAHGVVAGLFAVLTKVGIYALVRLWTLMFALYLVVSMWAGLRRGLGG